MAASEAMYGNMVSYISSSAYYGFIPLKHRESVNVHQWNVNGDANERLTSNGNCHGAMETDDDTRDVALVNNSCVIPEASRGSGSGIGLNNSATSAFSTSHGYPVAGFATFSAPERYAQQNAALARRRNRKRNNAGELMSVDAEQCKRLRKGSGNSCAYLGRGYTEDSGLASLRYKSSQLRVSFDKEDDESLAIETNCWRAAGNINPLISNAQKSADWKLNENEAEYEKMLLETHGCSAYHYHRLLSQNDDNNVQLEI